MLRRVCYSGHLAMSLISAFKPRSTRNSSVRHRSPLRRRKNKKRGNSEPDAPEGDAHSIITPSKHTPKPFRVLRGSVAAGGPLRPFRLVKQDIINIRRRYKSDWTVFNQLIFASAVYVFFTNLLPGITFASDLYVLTGKSWGTIEVVFSTGMCGVIFSLYVVLLSYILALFSINFRLSLSTSIEAFINHSIPRIMLNMELQILYTALDYPWCHRTFFSAS